MHAASVRETATSRTKTHNKHGRMMQHRPVRIVGLSSPMDEEKPDPKERLPARAGHDYDKNTTVENYFAVHITSLFPGAPRCPDRFAPTPVRMIGTLIRILTDHGPVSIEPRNATAHSCTHYHLAQGWPAR